MNTLRFFLSVSAIAATGGLLNFAEAGTKRGADLSASAKIDALVASKLTEKGIAANDSIDDATFLRRAYLDVAGRIPTIEEAEAFQSNQYPNKRERLIDDLLHSDGYVSNFYHFWADILRINGELDGAVKDAYELWVKDALKKNLPYDEMVRDLVSAQGKVWDNGATGYYFRDRGMPLDNMSNTVRIFLGTRLECAQCHNHPFDKWTQMDYFEMAAFSYGMNSKGYNDTPNRDRVNASMKGMGQAAYAEALGIPKLKGIRKGNVDKFFENPKSAKVLADSGLTEAEFREKMEKASEAIAGIEEKAEGMKAVLKELYDPLKYISIGENPKARVELPHDYQYSDAKPNDQVLAQTMFGAGIEPAQMEGGSIEAYATWMTSKENPTFTKVIANRLWKKVFGLGLIEPVDELTEQSVVSNPELLAYLEDLLKVLNYDMKACLEILYNTSTYQRAADRNELVMGEPYYFQGPVLRRMSAEQIWDSIVALALPEADHYRPRLPGQLATIEKQKLIYESLESRTPEEYMAMLEELAPAVGELPKKQEQLRAEMLKAKDAGDDAEFQRLRRELSSIGKEVSQQIAEIGYVKLKEKVNGKELLASIGLSEVTSGAMANSKTGDESAESMVVTSLPKVAFPEQPDGLDRSERKKWSGEQKADYNTYRGLISGMARASELDSPAKRGHFLRDFGQSDREVIQNAAADASVPQALNLLNGPMVEALTNKYAVFGKRIHDAGTPEEKTRMIFQAMLTREPTEREMGLAKAEIDREGEAAYEGLVWSLLNTQQFIFIQ